MKPDCTHCRERFSDYLDGLLAAPERAEMDAHLSACPDCRREMERWRATLDTVGGLPRPAAPEGFRARVMAQLPLDAAPSEEAEPERRERPRLLTLYLRALPVAAMLLIVFGVVAIVQRNEARGPRQRGAAPAAEPMSLARVRSAPAAAADHAAPPPAPAAAPAAPARRVAAAPAESMGGQGGAASYGNRAELAYRYAAPRRDEDGQKVAGRMVPQLEAKTRASGFAATDALKDMSGRQKKGTMLAMEERTAGGELVFRQTRSLPLAVERPEQVLTMYAADPADLIRRAVEVANRQGLEVTLVFKPGGRADISIQVPAARYDKLVAALSNLTAPQSQNLSNSAIAQGAFFRKALDDYNASNNLRQKQQQVEQQTRMAATGVMGLRERMQGPEVAAQSEAAPAGGASATGRAAASTGTPAATAAPAPSVVAGAPLRPVANAPAPEKPRQAGEKGNSAQDQAGPEAPPSVVNLQITIQRPPTRRPATPLP